MLDDIFKRKLMETSLINVCGSLFCLQIIEDAKSNFMYMSSMVRECLFESVQVSDHSIGLGQQILLRLNEEVIGHQIFE